jgi:hypothetical protein
MKRAPLLFAFSFCFIFSHSQSLKKVPVSNSRCFIYTYCGFNFEKEYSEDSSEVYVSECVKDEVSYGVICVKLLQPAADLEKAEEMLIDYLNYLKTSFSISKAVGYGRGHHLNKNENTRGVLDYWEDAEKNNWKIKGWTDRKFIGILYGYSAKELPEMKLNVFLESLRFPGM